MRYFTLPFLLLVALFNAGCWMEIHNGNQVWTCERADGKELKVIQVDKGPTVCNDTGYRIW